ncbi:cytochrome P450 [Phaeosphaeriaceae sp. PMI808]|nr:cytochrome P450 [Phaeosphaeriaceae sp. PMI808]
MAIGTLYSLLRRQNVVLAIVALVISPFLTFFLTTLLFYRKARSNASAKVPPTAPYFLPGIFHAFGMAFMGPQLYFAQLMKDYGEFSPFFVNAGPQSFLVLRDPSHLKKALLEPKATALNASSLERFDKMFGSTKVALDLYARKNISETDDSALEYAHTTLTQKYLTGASLSANMETYISILSKNLHNKMFQVGSWTQIEDTWSFFKQVITRCILESLFGGDLFKQYPGIVKDYWEFADAIEGFIPGLPRYWVSSAASQVQVRLLQGLEKWLKANHSGSEFARIADEDPTWDNTKGSKFIQERDDVLAKIECMDLRARAAEMLAIIHDCNSTIVPCTIWTLLEVLRRPKLTEKLTANISRYSPSQGAPYNIEDITSLPLMNSILAEIVRLRIASVEVHTTGQRLKLDDHYTVPKGMQIVMFSHDISTNRNAWAEARTGTTEKPLEEFWAERFLVSGNTGSIPKKIGQRNGPRTAFSMEGLESLNITIGNGQQPILGREYARAVHAATLAVLLNEFELEMCDDDFFDAVVPPLHENAYGVLKPVEKIEVRIKKRKLSEK